jgi:hypothetical protein
MDSIPYIGIFTLLIKFLFSIFNEPTPLTSLFFPFVHFPKLKSFLRKGKVRGLSLAGCLETLGRETLWRLRQPPTELLNSAGVLGSKALVMTLASALRVPSGGISLREGCLCSKIPERKSKRIFCMPVLDALPAVFQEILNRLVQINIHIGHFHLPGQEQLP